MKRSILTYLEKNGYTVKYDKFVYWYAWYAIKNNVRIPLALEGLIDNCGRSSYLVDLTDFNVNKFARAFNILENYYNASEDDRHNGNVNELIAYNSKLYVQDQYNRIKF